MKNRPFTAASVVAAAALIAGAILLTSSFFRVSCSRPSFSSLTSLSHPDLMTATVRYATSRVVPQQSLAEISESLAVLRKRAPCNFLIFGLGHDSLMWYALNAGGTTVFLEEDPSWYKTVLKGSPFLTAYHVEYRTHLSEADELLQGWKQEKMCAPENAYLKGNQRCRLALDNLPDVVYEKEWDFWIYALFNYLEKSKPLYYAAAPGRMAAIYSAMVMARARKGEGDTDIFLHDVNRKVEKTFAKEFLCDKYRVGAVGRLWHFRVPPISRRGNETGDPSKKFC
ncbi:glucuronoxylan 4-O-methyltransferase 1 [Carex littledalei]|uniref:Glucuronoxylan 4-O-methyltransferase 1 n=1 Tax=Carex littledalei TaxID=544730 RepID=A0A833REB9_9POAL|nr:glucuronoxylan 4-O-methyltransferase 1 [Carex littledalei]